MSIKNCISLFLLAVLLSAVAGCGKNNGNSIETRSMAQIHEEEGFPVSVMKVKPEVFYLALEFASAVTGVAESSASAMVSNYVEKLMAETGDFVQKDTVILTFPENTPGAGYYQGKAAYENSLQTFKRIEQLYSSNGVSRQDYDNAKTGLDVAKANWESVDNMINVKAPISGFITRLDVRETDTVESGDPLFTIADYNRIKARIWITEKDYSLIKTGMKAEALWENNIIYGSVVQVDLSVNPDRSAFGAILEFDNIDRKIKSGVTAQIRVTVYENPRAVAIDRKYISGTGENMHVFTASGNNTAEKRVVKPGNRYGQIIEIIEGLYPGDLLITEGSRIISENSRIKIVSGE